ncbi:hypothetical protein RA8CHR_01673 [Variovorax sp. RA8]|nr:hypothetical protein RA8CHR_01673 [Variovorax sp. RA8]
MPKQEFSIFFALVLRSAVGAVFSRLKGEPRHACKSDYRMHSPADSLCLHNHLSI